MAKKPVQKANDKNLIQDLILALQNKSPEIRELAAKLLGRGGAEAQSAVPTLLQRMSDDTELAMVRIAAAGALAKLKAEAPVVVPFLIWLLKETDYYDKDDAVTALADFGPAAFEAVNVLSDIVSDEKAYNLRGQAARALGEVGSAAKAVTPVLASVLVEENNIELVVRALDAIEFIGATKAAVPGLIAALNYQDPKTGDFRNRGGGWLHWDLQSSVAEILAALGAEAEAAIPTLEIIAASPTLEELEARERKSTSTSRQLQPKLPRRYTWQASREAAAKALQSIQKTIKARQKK